MPNNIVELREHLFDTIRMLKDGKMEVDRAKAVSEVAQTIINSAKVEVHYLEALGHDAATGFMDGTERNALPPRSNGNRPKGLSTGKHLGANVA
jgi:hypothetical protein